MENLQSLCNLLATLASDKISRLHHHYLCCEELEGDLTKFIKHPLKFAEMKRTELDNGQF